MDFERRFRTPCYIFNAIENEIFGNGEFQQKRDGTGKLGIDPQIRIIACPRVMVFGTAFDKVYFICEMYAPSVRKTFHSFLDEMLIAFRENFL